MDVARKDVHHTGQVLDPQLTTHVVHLGHKRGGEKSQRMMPEGGINGRAATTRKGGKEGRAGAEREAKSGRAGRRLACAACVRRGRDERTRSASVEQASGRSASCDDWRTVGPPPSSTFSSRSVSICTGGHGAGRGRSHWRACMDGGGGGRPKRRAAECFGRPMHDECSAA